MTSGIPIQTIDLGVLSDQGRTRPRNEDAYGYEQLLDIQGQSIGWIFVVADGVGGEYHGDIASKMAVRSVIDVYKTMSLQNPLVPPPDLLREAIHLTNSEVYNKAVDLNVAGHMGTTVVAAVLRPDGVLHVGWVGDSRLYVISRRLQKIRQVSKDHTEVAEKVRQNLMRHDQAINHPRRNVLSRSVGGLPETTPEFAEGTLEATDTILICTDGLTRHLASEQILTLALQHVSSEQIAHQLVGAANQLGGKDNITALLAHIGPREAALEPLPVTLDGDTEQFPDRQPVYGTQGRRRLIEDTIPLKSDMRERRRPLARLLIALIPLLFIAGLVLIVASQQMPSPALTATEVAALVTQEATVEPSPELSATPNSTQIAMQVTDLWMTDVWATGTAFTEFSTQYVPLTATALADMFMGSLTPLATDTEAPPLPTQEAIIAPITSTPTRRPTASASLIIQITVTPDGSSSTPAAPLVVASDTPASATIAPTIAVIVAPLIEPYPRGICLVTLGEAPVFTAVGGSAAFTLPADKVVAILQQGQPSYTVATQGVNQTYYSVKPNDGSAGSGWVRSEDLVAARNLSPEEQGEASLLPAPTSVTQVDEPANWLPDQNLLIRDSALACLPMRVKPDVTTVIHILESGTPAVLIAPSPVSVNGALWWNVRLNDGREGWVQQIYLAAPNP